MVKTIKKCTAWVLAAAILLSMACIGVYAQRAPFRYGDVNGDGKVSAADAMEVSKHTAKIITLTGDAFKAADVNGDGIVSVKDAILIQQYVAKVIDVFPVELIQPTDPTVQPTELPTTTPTEAPTIKPTDPERYDTLVNGKKANVGDEIVYTAYLYAKDLVAGVNAYVNYTGDVLKISDITLGSKKKAVLPILANGSSVLNFNPVDGSDSIYFNGANADEGYDFSAKESILVTVRFDVIKEGTASIGTSMTQILSMELDSSNKNQPLKDYTLTDKTEVIGGTVDPTEAPTQAPTDKPTEAPTAAPTDKPTAAPTDPTEAPTQKPTEAPTVAPTEAPTVAPTEAPTEKPTQAPTEQPTTPPSGDAVINGQKASIGDQVTYTAYLKANELVAGVNAHVTYTGGVLKLSQATLDSKKAQVIPVLATGSSVLNFDPVDGTSSVYFNGANSDEGYEFFAEKTVLVTLTFDVIGAGTAEIKTAIAQILSMQLDSSNKNQPLKDYTLTDETKVIKGTTDPTEPTEAPTVAPTEAPTEKPTQKPTEQPTTPSSGDAVINGQKANIGDQVTYTAYLKADELVAGVNAHVIYTGGVLKLSQATLDSKKAQVIPVLATGSSVLNFDPVDGTSSVYFNGANSDEGYEFFAEKTVLVTLTFDVIGAGTAEIKTAIAQILSMQLDSSNKNQPLKDYTLTDKTEVIGGTVDPTEPTEAPTVAPTEAPTEKPTQAPTEQPTTPPSGDAVINGQKASIGDQVTYTAYLKANELVAGVNAHVTYTGGVLKLSQATLDSKKAQVIPVLATGSSVLNFDPVDGTSSVYFNGANSDEGYEFFAEKTVLVTLTFDVIGAGTAEIKTAIAQILSMELDSSNKNQPLKDYTLTDETKVIKGTTDPTEPTEAPTQKPTEAPTVAPTEAPTEKPTQKPTEQPTTPSSGDAVINGQKASVGDQVTYTAYLKANELVAGVNAHVIYTGGVLKLSQATLDSKKAQVIPVLATGSSVLNFDPVDGTSSVYFNGANSDEGYEFFAEKTVLVTLTFDVIGAGTAEIKTAIAQILSMELDSSNKNQPLKDYTLTDETKVIKGTTDPTEPTEAPTQKPTEAPTVAPTEAPTEKPTQKPTEQPTTPSSGDAVINGQKANIGDQVTYTAYLKADELVAGVNAHVTYTGGVLKLSQATLDSKKAQVIPVLATGSSVLNFDPVDGTSSVYFNGANSDEGYEFFAEKTVLVTLTFDVIGAGTAEIKTAIAQILSMQLDSSNKNQPLKDYTLTGETKVIKGTTDPASDAVINGVTANIGDQVTYTAYISTSEAAAGIIAYVPYNDSVLKLSNETLTSKKNQVIPAFATGSSVLNFTPVDGSSAVYFNSADPDEGYDLPEGSVLVTLTFDVIGKGTAAVSPQVKQFLSMRKDADGKYLNLTDYQITSDLIKK